MLRFFFLYIFLSLIYLSKSQRNIQTCCEHATSPNARAAARPNALLALPRASMLALPRPNAPAAPSANAESRCLFLRLDCHTTRAPFF